MAPNDKQGTSKGASNKNFYVYREPGLSDAEYEKIKRNMHDYRNTMDRILETHYAPPNRISALQKEKTDLLRKSKDMQESRSVKTPESKHGKTLEKNRVDSEGNIAFYSASACQTPLFINNFTLGPEVCGDPFSIDDPLTTTIESHIVNERPTCSDGHIPTFYTYQDAACYQGVAERSEIGLESDTSCVTSVQFVAIAFTCNGFGNLDGNRWDNTGGEDDCGGEGGNEEGNDQGGNYNGCALGAGTDGDGIYTNGATGDRCDGISNGGCVATSSSGTVPLATASTSTSPSLPAIPAAATAPSPELPVPMNSANTNPSTMAQSPSTAATRRSPTTAIPQSTAPATSAATLLTTASAKPTGSESSTGVQALYCGLISTLAAVLMLSMSL